MRLITKQLCERIFRDERFPSVQLSLSSLTPLSNGAFIFEGDFFFRLVSFHVRRFSFETTFYLPRYPIVLGEEISLSLYRSTRLRTWKFYLCTNRVDPRRIFSNSLRFVAHSFPFFSFFLVFRLKNRIFIHQRGLVNLFTALDYSDPAAFQGSLFQPVREIPLWADCVFCDRTLNRQPRSKEGRHLRIIFGDS